MEALPTHWQSLYAVEGCVSLPKSALSLGSFPQHMQGSGTAGPGPVGSPVVEPSDAVDTQGKLQVSNRSGVICAEELEAAVCNLMCRRADGPDGLRGHFLRGLYTDTQPVSSVLYTVQRKMCLW